jgi:5'/3'-nucleotidase SurE
VNQSLLLTNDDGYLSPGLRALWEYLDREYSTRVVAPGRERSWIAKALSNPGPLTVEERAVGGKTVQVVNDGTPADCVNLGLYHLATNPRLVISGINIGPNFTSSLALASGTLGGALEAALNGIIGLAVSLDLDPGEEEALRTGWRAEHLAFFEPAARVVGAFLQRLLELGPDAQARLVNLVIPRHVTEPFPFVECEPLPYEYGSVFQEREGVYWNRRRGFIAETAHITAHSDVWTVQHNQIAFTCFTGTLETVPFDPQSKAAGI